MLVFKTLIPPSVLNNKFARYSSHFLSTFQPITPTYWPAMWLLKMLLMFSWETLVCNKTSLVAQTVKHLPTMWETWVRSMGGEDPLEKEMATYSSTLAWKIPWEEPVRLQSMGLQRIGHDWTTELNWWLSNIPSYKYITSSLSIHLSMGI